MAAGSNHSAVFDALFAWEDKLQAATWPKHPVTDHDVPSPTIGDLDVTFGAESVIIAALDASDAQLEWAATSPARRDELISLQCVIETNVKAVETAREALERVQVLAEVAQATLFDPSAAQPVVSLGFDNEVLLGGVQSVVPTARVVDGGWVARCEINVLLFAKN